MLKKQVARFIALFLTLAFSTSLFAHGRTWRFLGDTYINEAQDHDRIQVDGRYGPLRAVQLRVSGDAIFFQRVVVHYRNNMSEELAIGDRISPEGKTPVIDLTREPRVLESVELWYFREPWTHHPRVTLYGAR
jgi:hypothetical protein